MARRDFDSLDVPTDFKFTEEVFEIKEDFNDRRPDPTNYNIIFSTTKNCSGTENNPLFDNTSICKFCYYKSFAKKMNAVRKSKRKNFIEYQMNLREQPQLFLKELEEFMLDNEKVFDKVNYDLILEYRSIIDDFDLNKTGSKTSSFHEQIASAIGASIGTEEQLREFTMDIFISHSSKNLEIAKHLLDLIKTATNLSSDKIRCTSVPGYKLQGGSNTDEVLKKEINESKLLLALITKESMESTYVLFELGARWAVELPLIPIVKSSSDFSLFKGPLGNYHGISISDENDIHQLISEIGKTLEISLEPVELYNSKIKDLLSLVAEEEE